MEPRGSALSFFYKKNSQVNWLPNPDRPHRARCLLLWGGGGGGGGGGEEGGEKVETKLVQKCF